MDGMKVISAYLWHVIIPTGRLNLAQFYFMVLFRWLLQETLQGSLWISAELRNSVEAVLPAADLAKESRPTAMGVSLRGPL